MQFTEGAVISKPTDLDAAIEEAWATYRTSCLWNVRRPEAGQSVSTTVRALRANGDMAAWHLATRIERLASEGRQEIR